MCYSSTQILENELEWAKLRGDSLDEVDRLTQLLRHIKEDDKRHGKQKYFAYGFGRPELVVFADKDPYKPQKFKWGLLQLGTRQNWISERV